MTPQPTRLLSGLAAAFALTVFGSVALAAEAPAAAPAPAAKPAATKSESGKPAAQAAQEDGETTKPTIDNIINAIRQDDCPALERFLKAGFNPNHYDAFGYTPLTVAALDKRIVCINALLAAGADPNLASSAGWTPLIGAAMSGASGQIMSALVEKGANINAQNQWGCTALYYAAGFGALPTVDYLLLKGATYPGTGPECPTPRKIAELRGYPDVLERLQKAEAEAAAKTAKP